MKFVLASYGTRGDVEPCVVVGRELLRRGHEVCLAVPPDLVDYVDGAGLSAVAYGMDMTAYLNVHRDFGKSVFGKFWKIRDVIRLWREVWEPVSRCQEEMITTLRSMTDKADILVTALGFEEAAANVAEYHNIPLATLHYFPIRAHGQLLPVLPAPLTRSAMTVFWWLSWLMAKKPEDAQRRELGLPKARGPASRRIAERGSLEIQAYDEVCFPGLAAEWAQWNGQRPFVGALTMEPTEVDEDVVAWASAGPPPIYFGFGSFPVESAADTVEMISAACTQLGERALISAGWNDFSRVPTSEHVKVVGPVNFAATFPACRAVVHHGGAGTTAAGLRAGVPTLILWTMADQPFWGLQVKRLKVGTARRFSATTRDSLVADLRRILAPEYVTRAREFATRMTKPTDSARAAADHLENFARSRRAGVKGDTDSVK